MALWVHFPPHKPLLWRALLRAVTKVLDLAVAREAKPRLPHKRSIGLHFFILFFVDLHYEVIESSFYPLEPLIVIALLDFAFHE